MKTFKANPGKEIYLRHDSVRYARYPIKTHKITSKDTVPAIIKKYVSKHIKKGDIVVLSERVVAITQDRMIPLDQISPTTIATLLSTFVSKHPGGIGLGSPWTMQAAIEEVGLLRIFFAGIVAAFVRPFGIKGIFYKIAGGDINAIDGPTEYTLPPGNKSVTLGPTRPQRVVDELYKEFGTGGFAIVDANDYGVRAMAVSSGISTQLVEAVLSDNPFGQAREQTPIAIVRRMR